jgi:CheY-like chemotaxis protein
MLAAEPDIDLILLDISMPVMDGLTMLARLREQHSPVRAIIVSAYGDMTNLRTAMNRGAFDFVTKPVDSPDRRTGAVHDGNIVDLSYACGKYVCEREAEPGPMQTAEALVRRIPDGQAKAVTVPVQPVQFPCACRRPHTTGRRSVNPA